VLRPLLRSRSQICARRHTSVDFPFVLSLIWRLLRSKWRNLGAPRRRTHLRVELGRVIPALAVWLRCAACNSLGVDMWTCGQPKSSTELVPRPGEPPGGVRVVVVQAIRPARSAGAPCGTRTNICLRLKSKANRPDLPSISKRRQINNKRNISF
jgi:hypothetical protein